MRNVLKRMKKIIYFFVQQNFHFKFLGLSILRTWYRNANQWYPITSWLWRLNPKASEAWGRSPLRLILFLVLEQKIWSKNKHKYILIFIKQRLFHRQQRFYGLKNFMVCALYWWGSEVQNYNLQLKWWKLQ